MDGLIEMVRLTYDATEAGPAYRPSAEIVDTGTQPSMNTSDVYYADKRRVDLDAKCWRLQTAARRTERQIADLFGRIKIEIPGTDEQQREIKAAVLRTINPITRAEVEWQIATIRSANARFGTSEWESFKGLLESISPDFVARLESILDRRSELYAKSFGVTNVIVPGEDVGALFGLGQQTLVYLEQDKGLSSAIKAFGGRDLRRLIRELKADGDPSALVAYAENMAALTTEFQTTVVEPVKTFLARKYRDELGVDIPDDTPIVTKGVPGPPYKLSFKDLVATTRVRDEVENDSRANGGEVLLDCDIYAKGFGRELRNNGSPNPGKNRRRAAVTLQINRRSLGTVATPFAWLNDDAINSCMEAIMVRANRAYASGTPGALRVRVINSLRWHKDIRDSVANAEPLNKYDGSAVLSNTTDEHVRQWLEADVVLIPRHQGVHWGLSAWYPRRPTEPHNLVHFDSMRRNVMFDDGEVSGIERKLEYLRRRYNYIVTNGDPKVPSGHILAFTRLQRLERERNEPGADTTAIDAEIIAVSCELVRPIQPAPLEKLKSSLYNNSPQQQNYDVATMTSHADEMNKSECGVFTLVNADCVANSVEITRDMFGGTVPENVAWMLRYGRRRCLWLIWAETRARATTHRAITEPPSAIQLPTGGPSDAILVEASDDERSGGDDSDIEQTGGGDGGVRFYEGGPPTDSGGDGPTLTHRGYKKEMVAADLPTYGEWKAGYVEIPFTMADGVRSSVLVRYPDYDSAGVTTDLVPGDAGRGLSPAQYAQVMGLTKVITLPGGGAYVGSGPGRRPTWRSPHGWRPRRPESRAGREIPAGSRNQRHTPVHLDDRDVDSSDDSNSIDSTPSTVSFARSVRLVKRVIE